MDSKDEVILMFSIIIPTYNRASFISKAVESVIAQFYVDWELIIIDDASTDNTQDLLLRYSDQRIQVYVNEKNMDRSASRNKGIALAKGEYICFLDSDDYFLPHHLESLALLIGSTQQKVSLFHTGVQQYRSSNNTVKVIDRIQGVNPVETVIACHIPVITVAIHHSILKQFQFDVTMHINEDVYLFAQIAAVFPTVYTPEVSVVWVLHGNNTIDQEVDYLSPQLWATKKMVQNPVIAKFLSREFIVEKKFDLYTQLIYFYAIKHKYFKSVEFFVKGLTIAPLKKQNWTNFLNVIYHLPGGLFLKKTISLVKFVN